MPVTHKRPPPRPPRRNEPAEIAELRRIKDAQPELTSAVDLQIALLELQRRVQARVPLPPMQLDSARIQQHQAAGRPLLRFEDIPLDWTDFRLMFRETAELLRRHDVLGEHDCRQAQALAREADRLQPLVIDWYTAAAGEPRRASGGSPSEPPLGGMLDQVVLLAMRPFLARCAEAFLPSIDLSAWKREHCPLCGGEPEFATITPAADRLLICSRCSTRWPFDSLACPFCRNTDRARITSFASRDGTYRLYACDTCHRYLKAYDGRRTTRPVMVPVDSVKTLPLDAAAMRKGYIG